jgi:FkbM family methyltransferase
MRVLRSILGLIREVRTIAARADGLSTVIRYATDLVRVKLGHRSLLSDGLRTLRLRDGVIISYRLNRGDLQSIREVWLDEEYKLPEIAAPYGTLIDLGANIGLTSLWLAKTYNYHTVVAVEPSADNAEIVRVNLANNGINAVVVEAAVGPHDGTAVFATSAESNMGRLGTADEQGVEVKLMSMATILHDANVSGTIDLLKLDIEGGEEQLVNGDLSWLTGVRRIVAELHPAIVNTDKVIAAISAAGLEFQPGSGDLSADSVMDMFVRREHDASKAA